MNIMLFHYVFRVHGLGVNELYNISGVSPANILNWVNNLSRLRKNEAETLERSIYKYLLRMKDTSKELEAILENTNTSKSAGRKRQPGTV